MESITELLTKVQAGDTAAIETLIEQNRDRLVRMVQLRLDRRLRGRVDASDIVQEATLEAARRLPEYARSPAMEFYLWLRWITGDKLVDAHRHHLGVQKRNVANEVSIFNQPLPAVTSAAIAEQIVGHQTSPSESAQRAEMQLAVQNALNQLEPVDREVLVLRHFEHLSNAETAEVLGLKKSGASKRYVLALRRLRQTMGESSLFNRSSVR